MPWYWWLLIVVGAFNAGIVLGGWLARTKHDTWAPRG